MPFDRCLSHTRRLGAALYAVLALASLTSCRDTPPVFTEPTDAADGTPTLCTRREDCAGKGICVGGVCEAVTPCQMDDQCTAAGKVCHQSRGYCVACDGRNGQCGANETCQFDFTCVPVGAGRDAGSSDGGMCTGACTDRTMCAPDLVCRASTCCPPPARCSSPEQCPTNRPLCNGATGECFGGDSCTVDNDCAARAGCSGNRCFCDKPMGSATGECHQRTDECMDDMGCRDMNSMYNGRFCTLLTSPKTCAPAPNCTRDADCASSGLVCDLGGGSPSNGRCVNGTPCPTGNECTASQACVTGVCAAKSCNNTPNFCNAATETCDMATGACIPQATGCQRDTDCAGGNYCDLALNRCSPGCRDATDCGGAVCDAAHQCQSAMGALCSDCMTDGDCPAGTSCHTNPFTMAKKCQEPCSIFASQDCVINPAASCAIVWCSCL